MAQRQDITLVLLCLAYVKLNMLYIFKFCDRKRSSFWFRSVTLEIFRIGDIVPYLWKSMAWLSVKTKTEKQELIKLIFIYKDIFSCFRFWASWNCFRWNPISRRMFRGQIRHYGRSQLFSPEIVGSPTEFVPLFQYSDNNPCQLPKRHKEETTT